MFSRLFSAFTGKGAEEVESLDEDVAVTLASLPSDLIRVFILRETEEKEHQLLYDSHLHSPSTQKPQSPATDGTKPTTTTTTAPQKESSVKNVTMFGEVMFGAIPLSLQGTTTKIHCIKGGDQILVTSLFRYTHVAKTESAFLVRHPHLSVGDSSVGIRKAASQSSQTTKAAQTVYYYHQQHQHLKKLQDEQRAKEQGSLPTSSSATLASSSSTASATSETSQEGLQPPRQSISTPTASKSLLTAQLLESQQPSQSHSTPDLQAQSEGSGSASPSKDGGFPTASSASYRSLASIRPPGDEYQHLRGNAHRQRSTSCALGHMPRTVKTSFAVGVLFTYSTNTSFIRDFVFSHFAVIEYRLKLLIREFTACLRDNDFMTTGTFHRSSSTPASWTTTAGKPRMPTFTATSRPSELSSPAIGSSAKPPYQPDPHLVDSVEEFKTAIIDFITAPRLQRPIWLHVVTFPDERKEVLTYFLNHLKAVNETLNRSSARRLLSTLLTSVLTHNLAWMKTLGPNPLAESSASNSNPNSHLGALAQELRDLYGVSKRRLARTVVVGMDARLVRRLLTVLSYFLRCGEVFQSRGTNSPEENTMIDALPSLELNQRADLSMEEVLTLQMQQQQLQSAVVGTTTITEETGDGKTDKKVNLVTLSSADVSRLDGDLKKGVFQSFGRSMFASYCPRYHGDFAAMGVPSNEFFPSLAWDLQVSVEHAIFGGNRTGTLPSSSSLASSTCIVADVNHQSCQVIVYDPSAFSLAPPLVWRGGVYKNTAILKAPCSRLVHKIIDDVANLWKLGMPSDACIMHLEDRLQELVTKGALLRNLLAEEHRKTCVLSFSLYALKSVSPCLNELQEGDIPLLASIAMQLDPSIEIEFDEGVIFYRPATSTPANPS